MSAAPALKLVDPETGELHEPGRCPSCARMEVEVEEITRKMKGALLEARKAREEAHSAAWGDPKRPVVELLHRLHHAATEASPHPTRRKRLDTKEIKATLSCLNTIGFRQCVLAVVGQTWDPSKGPPRKNGRSETFNQFELCFRDSAKATSFAERIPKGYEPEAERIAAVGGVPVDWVRELLKEEA